MQKKFTLAIIITMLIPFLLKAEWVPMNNSTKQIAPNVTLISNDISSTILTIEISGFDLKDLNADGQEYQVVDLLTESFVTKPGMPALPYIAKTLAIPDQAAVSFEILETGNVQTFQNISLAPARESWLEGYPETPYIKDENAYSNNDIFPGSLIDIEPPSIFRDFRITRVSVYPIRYNPVKKELEVTTSLTVKINYVSGDVVNPKNTVKKPIAPSFGQLYQSFIFNYQNVLDDNYGGKENGHELMLCIMPDEFYNELSNICRMETSKWNRYSYY
ncbi:MAG: C25 family peptidase propeptide domain-containing protein [Bacteroidales bacterium]